LDVPPSPKDQSDEWAPPKLSSLKDTTTASPDALIHVLDLRKVNLAMGVCADALIEWQKEKIMNVNRARQH
jgi:hypothetical protein